jgi:hypothetical protein
MQEEDPSEAYPIPSHEISPVDYKALLAAKKAYEDSLFVRAITADFGRQWALCCSEETNCTCTAPTPLPIPPPPLRS